MNHIEHEHEAPSIWRTRYGIGLLVLGGVAAYLLITGHAAHLAGALPFLLILSCPLMHLFMHHGHHHGHSNHSGTVGQVGDAGVPDVRESSPDQRDKRNEGRW